MTKDGKLSKRDREALLRAHRILNEWCDKNSDGDYLDDITYSFASEAAGAISNFLYDTRGE